ncbi:DUF4232 domain-containing protein [Streptomyces sp. CJ_13]|uniref:DUF4232 domain-containing protein n=1 Tax=Streptomyces TaxID=1883 RepID=UPI000F3AA994|nr:MULTISPECIES: DUF4232 domain-containing protein [unclassified Streptomyces]MBT1185792.1 DUF4232 domain-containing protein [Streptomyces sp. CJ_13]
MRVHKLTVIAALAAAASLSLTACQNGDDGAAGSGTSSVPTASSSKGAPDQAGSAQPGGTNSPGTSSSGNGGGTAGKGTAAGTTKPDTGKTAKCRTDDLEIKALDHTIDGDTDGTVAVELKNRSGRDCAISGYAGVDLKTSAGSLSAKRTGEQAPAGVLKKGKSVAFGINYPLNTSGGSGVRITGLVVTPPDETKSVTLPWPGTATLPVTDGSGSPVKVGPIGSAGQGE